TAFYELAMDSLRSNQGKVDWQAPKDWFAAAPALAKLAGLTGRQSYLDEVQRGFEQLQTQHWNQDKQLWGKAAGYSPMATAWMLMGACRMYRELPAEDPWQQQLGDHIRLLAERLKSLQQTSGHWPVDLSKPTGQGAPQAEATLPITYGLAVAMQAGLIPRSEYESVILRAWEAGIEVPVSDPTAAGLRMLAARELLGL
ncbi:MAG: glycoside hydrolase family 88 protein, partial [Bacteroidota bacterium]